MIRSETIPEIGQLVEVRGRHWVVTGVTASSLPPDVLGGETDRQHLLALSSVEDDSLSEELEVVWEAEVGRRIRERATLPEVRADGFDDPAELAAFLDAVRWGAVTSAEGDTLQSPFRSGISIEEYQLEPLVRALGQPRVNLLIADDVGLGKTIEAGLIVQELLLRHRVRRVMVVCPATLTLKWQGEMREKFGLDFTIVDSNRLRELRRTHGIAANPFRVYPLTIVSLQWLAGPRAQRILDEVLPATPTFPRFFDLLVVDEAHHVAPKAPRAVYAVDTLQTRAMRRLTQHFEHRLFLSATPHNGYRESWTALLAMLDPLRFARGVEPDESAREQVVVRRMKDAIRTPDGTPRFAQREVHALPVAYSEIEREAHRLLQSLADLRRSRAGSGLRRSAVDIATLLLKKRLFSSPQAFATTLEHYADTLRRKQRQMAPPEPAAAPTWLREIELAGEEESNDLARAEAEHDQIARATDYAAPLTEDEDRLLGSLVEWARRYGDRPDAKATALLRFLEETCRPGGHWNDERVVVFTEYRDTQKWLVELLHAHGLAGEQLQLIYGGQEEDEREHVKNAFQAEPWRAPVRILLATDAAGEGIDLQLQCHRVVNYDIPFNPNRLEQRIGRIDRHGQRTAPKAYHFIGEGWEQAPPGSFERDLEFLSRVARKVASQAEDLGAVNSVLEVAIQRHMVGDLGRSIDPLTVSGTAASRSLRAERELRERVEALGRRLRLSIEDLQVGPANVERAVGTALSLAHQPSLLPLPDPRDGGSGLFQVPALHGGWQRASVGLEDPLSGEARPITFDHDRVDGRPDVVLAHLGHPLVAMSTRLLRAAVWGSDHGGLNRVTACLAGGDLEAQVLAVYSRLVLVGADGSRLHEEVFPSGGWLRGDRFDPLGVTRLGEILRATLATGPVRPAPAAAQESLASEWPRLQERLSTVIRARAREREESLRGRLGDLRRREIENLDAAVGQFRRTLEKALVDPAYEQLELRLSQADERAQLRRDVEGWRATLEGLDAQRAAEHQQIERRYADIQALTFPAAVVLVVPQEGAGLR